MILKLSILYFPAQSPALNSSFLAIDFNENSQSLDLGCAWKYITVPFFASSSSSSFSSSLYTPTPQLSMTKKIRAKKNWGLEEREFIKFIHECVTMKSCFYHFAFFGEWERKSEREGFFCEGQMRKNVLPQISASDFYRVPALKSLRLFRSQNKTEGNQHEDIWDLRFFDIKFKHKFAKWHLFWMCSKKLCKDFFLFYYCKCILNCWLSQKLNKFFINWNFLLKNQFFKEFLSDNLIY